MATGKPDTAEADEAAETPVAGGSATASDSRQPDRNPPTPNNACHAGGRSSEYFDLFDRAPVAYLTLIDGDVVRDANAAAARLLGVARKEIVGRPFSEHVVPEDLDAFRRHIRTLDEACEPHSVELRLLRAGVHDTPQVGEARFWAHLSSTTHRGDDGELLLWVTFTDVDRDKRADDVMGARARINQSALGAPLDEIIQKLLDEAEAATGSTIGFFHLVDEDERSLTLQTWSTNTLATQCSAEGKGSHYSIERAGVWADCLRERRPLIHNDYASLPNKKGLPKGHAPLVRELTVPVFRGDKVRVIIGVGNKPTDYDSYDVDAVTQIATQALDIVHAKRTEDELHKTRSLLQAVVDGTSDAVYIKDLNGRYLMFNEAAARAVGKSAEEVIGCDDTELFGPNEASALMAGDRKIIEDGVTTTREEHLTTAERGPVVYSSTKGPIRDSNGSVYGLFGISRDVTQECAAEAALSESERWLKESQRVASLGHYVFDIVNDHWRCSDALCAVFGIKESYQRDFAGWLEIVHPADRERMSAHFKEDVLCERVPFDMEYRIVRPSDGAVRWVHGLGKVEWDEGGNPLSMFGIIQDITDSRNAREALRERNAFIEAALDNAPIGFALNAIDDGRSLFVGRSFERIYGVPSGSLGDVESFFEHVYADSVVRDQMRERITADTASGDPSRMRWESIPITTQSGEERVITASNIPLAEQNLMISTVEDVTEKSRAEQALRESELKYRTITDNISDVVWILDPETRMFRYVSPSVCALRGFRPEEVLAQPLSATMMPEAALGMNERIDQRVADLVSGRANDGLCYSEEVEQLRKDGSTVWTEVVTCYRINKETGKPEIHGVTHDISGRRRADRLLRESEARFRAVFEGAADGIMLLDSDGRVAIVNAAMAKMHGYTVDEMHAMDLAELDVPEATKLAPERLKRLFAGELLSFEIEHFRKGGERIPVEISASMVVLGEAKYILAFQRDITQRKQVEEELARRGERLEELAEERERNLEQLAASLASIISVVGLIVETRDPYTAGHERRVAELSVRIAQELGMTDEHVEKIRIAGLLHDVGKISIPAEILSKPGRLTPIEFSLIKCHAEDSHRILNSANMGSEITEMVYQHHERCDGSGYPRGLPGRELVEGAKVLMVADVVEAMSTDRPYRAALGIGPALAEIERGSGLQYDVGVAQACMRVFQAGFEFSPSGETDASCTPSVAPD